MSTMNLEARRHTSRVLSDWVSSDAGRAERVARASAAPGLRNEGQNLTFDDPRVWEMFGASRSAAGMAVTPDNAMRVAAVYRSNALISGAFASLPRHVFRQNGAAKERVHGGILSTLLNEEPTPRFTAAAHWELIGSNVLLRGDQFTFIGRDRKGAPGELLPLTWSSVHVEREQTKTTDRLKYFIQDGSRTWGCDQDDMLHFPGFGFDGVRGTSVIRHAARNAAGTAMAMDEYSGRFFAGGAHPSIVLETANKMNPELINSLQQAFVSKYSGAENAHRLPLILTEGLKATTLSLTAEDAQLLEGRKFQVIDIARAFGVPPHLIGETSAATSWGSGMEELGRSFVTFTLQPHLVRFEQELNRKLTRGTGTFIEFNREALLQGNIEGQSKVFRAALGGPGQGPGYMVVDEIRALRNLPPLGGKCAEVYFPPEKPAATPKDGEDDEDPEVSPAAT